MADSLYRLTITRTDGAQVSIKPGFDSEVEFADALAERLAWDEEALADAIVSKGVGVGRTQAQVRRAIISTLHDWKISHVRMALRRIFKDLKDGVDPL